MRFARLRRIRAGLFPASDRATGQSVSAWRREEGRQGGRHGGWSVGFWLILGGVIEWVAITLLRGAMEAVDAVLRLYFDGDLDSAFAFGGQVAGVHRRGAQRRRIHRGDHDRLLPHPRSLGGWLAS